MKKRILSLGVSLLLTAALLTGCSTSGTEAPAAEPSGGSNEDLTFIMIPNCVHPWYDQVNMGAQQQAEVLSKMYGANITVDYRAPQLADVAEQNSVLEQAAATKPDGIAFAPIDYEGSKAIIDEIRAQGIPVVMFDAPIQAGSGLTCVGNDFAEQALVAAQRMVEILDGEGKVAIMHGVPSAANQAARYDAYIEFFKDYPGIEVVDGGIDNDNIEDAKTQAAAVIAANPDIDGYLSVNASGPIGQCSAIEEAGKVGEIKVVGMENLIEMLEYIKSGTMDSSSSTKPIMQGEMCTLMLFNMCVGEAEDVPQFVDTGILYVDSENVDEWIEVVGS